MTYRLYADSDVIESPAAARVADTLGVPLESCIPTVQGDPYVSAKRTVRLSNYKGRFLKPCPGTSRHTCCGYNFLNIATNCPIDCTYCILQDYLGTEPITIHCNTDDMLRELEDSIAASGKRFLRIGTGELTDSLAIDEITGYTKELVPFFAGFDNTVLELKTKTDRIDNLIGLEHGRRTIVAWSLNSESIAESDETGAPSPADRIAAAKRCQDEGYPLAFHFDPLIEHPGWEKGYADVIQILFDQGIREDNVAWISMGTLRFTPRVGKIVAQRFPGSVIRTGEFVTGKDGKKRYYKPVRIEMYRTIAALIRKGWPNAFTYLCMESPSVWSASLGSSPTASELSGALDERARLMGSGRV